MNNGELLKIIHNEICVESDRLVPLLLTKDGHDILNPNLLTNSETIMHLLCKWTRSCDVEIAKTWLSFKFHIPVDLDTIDETGATCVYHVINKHSTYGHILLKVILDSKPGRKLLLRETCNSSPLMDTLSNSTIWKDNKHAKRLLGIIICHVNMRAITDEHKRRMKLVEDRDLVSLKKEM